jgi:hypothetical protein
MGRATSLPYLGNSCLSLETFCSTLKRFWPMKPLRGFAHAGLRLRDFLTPRSL